MCAITYLQTDIVDIFRSLPKGRCAEGDDDISRHMRLKSDILTASYQSQGAFGLGAQVGGLAVNATVEWRQ